MTATAGARRGAARQPRDAVRAVRLGARSRVVLALVTVAGLASFGWPLVVAPDAGIGHDRDAPLVFAALLGLLVVVLLAEIGSGAAGHGLDAKAVAMTGVLAAVGAALRPLGAGVTGFQPMFAVLVLGGRALGPGFGFVLGAVTMLASALLTAGVGPWLPFQMMGAGWVGLGAGLLPRASGRAEVWLLAGYGTLCGLGYGFLLNLWFWPFTVGLESGLSFEPGAPLTDNLSRFLAFCLVTSLGFDIPRALGNLALLLVVGGPVLRALRRATRRAAFGAPVVFGSAASAKPAQPTATVSSGPRHHRERDL